MKIVNVKLSENVDSCIKQCIRGSERSKHGYTTYYKIGAGFDCETTITPKKYAYAYIWQFSINDTVFIGRTTKHFFEFMKLLDKNLKSEYYRRTHKKPKQFPQLLVYIANFGYEWSFFKSEMVELGIRKVFAKKKRQPLSVSVGDCIEFRECLGLWGNSLKEIAKNYTKTQKAVGDLDYNVSRNSYTVLSRRELGYVCNDVLILSELGLITFERFRKKSIPYTQTGIIRNEVKNRIKAKGNLVFNSTKEAVKRIYPHSLNEYNKAMKYLFCGGLTHSNYEYVGKILYDVQCADLTSDYPAQMAHFSYPAGTLLENCTVKELEHYPHFYALFTFYNVRPINGHTIVSEHKLISYSNATFDNGRVYSADYIRLYLNEIDLENFNMFYTYDDDFIISDIHCFTQSKPIPKELFDVLFEQYLIKAELKKNEQTETIEYIESKKVVNGCFGFTATRLYLTDILFDGSDITERDKIKKYRSIVYNRNMMTFTPGRTYTMKNELEEIYRLLTKDIWLSPFIAVWCTSYARRVLCDVISKFPDCIVQYDTDSVYFLMCHYQSNELRAYLENYNKEIEAKNKELFDNPLYWDLGTWDFENPCTRFKCLGAKRYLKYQKGKIKLVCAGAKSKAFVKYCDENHLDYFKAFKKDMLLDEASSMKTTLKYYDRKEEPYTDTIIDEQGHIQDVKIKTCAVITDIPFQLFVSDTWLNLIKYWKSEEKKL